MHKICVLHLCITGTRTTRHPLSRPAPHLRATRVRQAGLIGLAKGKKKFFCLAASYPVEVGNSTERASGHVAGGDCPLSLAKILPISHVSDFSSLLSSFQSTPHGMWHVAIFQNLKELKQKKNWDTKHSKKII